MTFSSGTHHRNGFTLVELLVVITIIGMLVALLIPAVQSARGVARTAQCSSQLGELATAIAAYETSKGSYPGYAQFVKRGSNRWASIGYSPENKLSVTWSSAPNVPLSWAAMILRNIERQDIWDQIIAADATPEIRPIEVFICPDDGEATSTADFPALSYSANTGAWDRDDSGKPLEDKNDPNVGDTGPNGVMFNLAQWEILQKKGPKTRISGIRDGANMTIMLTENTHKSYEPESSPPACTWLYGTEQHLGVVWVVNTTPQPGNDLNRQEGINRNAADLVAYDPAWPRFARPSSGHSGGVNAAFCDTHVKFLPETIDYIVYQQLLTTNGAKCVDPTNHAANLSPGDPGEPIYEFRTASPLSEADYQ